MIPPRDRLDTLARQGRIALVDLVRSPSHEARLAFPSVMQNVLERSGGRLAWAGSIDQQLIGHGSEHFCDVLVSEFPNREACIGALAERATWEPEAFVSEIKSFVAAPWPALAPFISRAYFGLLRLRGGGPPAWDPDAEPAPMLSSLGIAAPEIGPEPDQLASLIEAESEQRVVMLNFLQYRENALYPGEAIDATSGAAAYTRYGRNAMGLIGRLGGRVRWAGERVKLLSEGPEEDWSSVALVEYPSRRAFLGMVRSDAYRSRGHHRDAGLERSDLLVCTSHARFF